ncbi:hypothetical protein P43SY_008335 [Pythium insidiosum]|uniref:Uncharacterized protein n=1 Tax=Pythium insidiosum TaxID=114742 RepID=A0AAD5M940_PYTIN|nr:hypothetical protein P43SY_008335 [Pythium insidiosum]
MNTIVASADAGAAHPPPAAPLPRKRLIAEAAGDAASHVVALSHEGESDRAEPAAVTQRAVHSDDGSSARSMDDAGSLMGQMKKRKFVHTTEAQRRSMLEWLETPPHFEWLTAPAGAAVLKNAAGKRLKKTDGFRALMRHVNSETNADWSMEVTKSRFESFLTTYRKAKALVTQRDFGVTQSDRARGITDVDQKLNSICLYFDRIDALFSATTGRGRHHVRVVEPAAKKWMDHPGAARLPEAKPESPAAGPPVEWQPAAEEANGDATAAAPALVETQPQSLDATEDEHPDASSTPEPEDVGTDCRQDVAAEEADVEGAIDAPAERSPQPAEPMSALERERLDLLQEQLAMQKRDLELRERALQRQEEEQRQRIRADIVGKLIEAGKGLSEIKEYLALIEGGA